MRLAVAILLFTLGCAGSGPTDTANGPIAPLADASIAPYTIATSESGALRVEVRTTPDQPPTRGLSTIALDISDAKTDAMQGGLELQVVPWMPAMGHGTSVKPAVEARPDGTYVVSRVNMYMGGQWDLRISTSGTVTDRVTLHFSIR
jgi:hypothetical protein